MLFTRALGLLDKKSCHLEVVNMRNMGPARTVLETGSLSPWKESWEMRICGKEYVVPIVYGPDSTGTRIQISPSEIHPKQPMGRQSHQSSRVRIKLVSYRIFAHHKEQNGLSNGS